MASFSQNRAPQFSNYTPQIDSDTYAKALSMKDQQYQAGAQKVQSTIESVAGLPVASERDREYLSSKVKQITSDINGNVGTDFSNVNQVNSIAGHISSISNDPNIQAAVQSTYNVKDLRQSQKLDQDKHGASAIANIDQSESEYQNWLQNGKLGEVFKGKHTPYIDINKGADDFLDQIKPDLKKLVHLATDEEGMEGWEVAIQSYEGVNKKKLETALDEFINSTPGVGAQMNINARYEYKGYTGDDFKPRAETIAGREYNQNNKDILDLEKQKVQSNKESEKKQIDDFIKQKQDMNKELLRPDLGDQAKTMFNHPEYHDKTINDLYSRNWKLGILTAHTGGEKYEEDVKGMSPREVYFKNMELKEKDRNYDLAYLKYKLDEKDYLLRKDKQEHDLSSTTVPTSPADATKIKDNYTKLVADNQSREQDHLGSQINLLNDLFTVNGVGIDSTGNSKYFTEDPLSGKLTIRDDYIPLTDKAQGIKAGKWTKALVDLSGRLEYGKDYISTKDYLLGYTDKHGVKKDGIIDNLVNAHSDGNYGMPNEKGITLGQMSVDKLRELKEQNRKKELYNSAQSIIDKRWQAEVLANPENRNIYQQIENRMQPFTATANNKSVKINPTDITNYLAYQKEYDAHAHNLASDQDARELSDALATKYNITPEKQYVLDNHFRNIGELQKNLLNKQSEFKSNLAKSLGLSQLGVGVKVVDGKDEHFKDQAQTTMAGLNHLDPSGSNYSDLRKMLKKDQDKSVAIIEGYDESNKEAPYFYEGSDAEGIKTRVHFTPKDAAILGFSVKAPVESPLEEILRVSSVATNGRLETTYPIGKSPSWEESTYLTTVKDKHNSIEIRYGVVHPKDGAYYLHVYKHNSSNPKEDPKKEEIPFSNSKDLQNHLVSILQSK